MEANRMCESIALKFRRRIVAAANIAFLSMAAAGCLWSVAYAQGIPAAPSTDASQPASGAKHVRSTQDNMHTINYLLANHDRMSFSYRLIRHGVRTFNTSKSPDVVNAIQIHAADMKVRMDQGVNVRPSDPLFQELVLHHAAIKIHLKNLPDGVMEDETSSDPQVVLLIRAHTKVVAEFVREGMARAREPSLLPKGYHAK
jgi:hypothetical protein